MKVKNFQAKVRRWFQTRGYGKLSRHDVSIDDPLLLVPQDVDRVAVSLGSRMRVFVDEKPQGQDLKVCFLPHGQSVRIEVQDRTDIIVGERIRFSTTDPSFEPLVTQIQTFLRPKEFGVISYLGVSGNPQSVWCLILVNEDLSVNFFVPESDELSLPLKRSFPMSFVLQVAPTHCIQWEGKANVDTINVPEFVSQDPLYAGNQVYAFSAQPDWIRLTNVSPNPWDVGELSFVSMSHDS